MFGFMRRRKPSGFEDLPEVRDCLKVMTGEAMNVYVGTLVEHLLDFGKTSEDVEKAKGEDARVPAEVRAGRDPPRRPGPRAGGGALGAREPCAGPDLDSCV